MKMRAPYFYVPVLCSKIQKIFCPDKETSRVSINIMEWVNKDKDNSKKPYELPPAPYSKGLRKYQRCRKAVAVKIQRADRLFSAKAP